MSWFFLDTHVRGEAVYGWLSADKVRVWKAVGRGHALLAEVAKRIDRQELTVADGICSVAGPGPFSAIRSGVLVANLLARIHGLPLYVVTVDESADLAGLGARLSAGKLKPVGYAAPVYDCEPNITVKTV